MVKIDTDDMIVVLMEFIMGAVALAIVGPFALGFIFLLYPRIQEAAERKDKEVMVGFAGFVIFLMLWAAWILLVIALAFEPAEGG